MTSNPQQQPGASFNPFLRLPRELRDEIYKCVLHTPGLSPASLTEPYKFPSLNLSILRVNKQISAEASEIFYGTTVLPIRISRSDAPSKDGDTIHYISQETPWDILCYRYRGKDGNLYSPNNTVMFSYQNEFIHPDDAFPATAYGNRFRKIRIEISDHRKLLDVQKAGFTTMKLLLLAVDRLASLISTADRDERLTLEICAFSRVFDKDPDFKEDLGSISDKTIYNELVKMYRERVYKELVETIWPLTKGPWEYTIHAPEALKTEFPGLLEETLGMCDGVANKEKNPRMEGGWKEPTTGWDVWLGWGKGLRYVGGGAKEIDSMNEDDL
ncbi:hypothetical protein TWF481_008793 [Arthrobotrys musiformis]|uniref:F-box domain-containing protein n=1 Tax=Arthrobotrys musiformis TaxID=47236 RepID=A0AAV9W883_9PEZI